MQTDSIQFLEELTIDFRAFLEEWDKKALKQSCPQTEAVVQFSNEQRKHLGLLIQKSTNSAEIFIRNQQLLQEEGNGFEPLLGECQRFIVRSRQELTDIRQAIATYTPFLRMRQSLLYKAYGDYADKKAARTSAMDTVFILDHLRSAENMGAIFRSSECFGVKEIAICGYSPLPFDTKVMKTAKNTESWVAWEYFARTESAIGYYRKKGYNIVALEITREAVPYVDATFDSKTAFVLGNERHGIQPEVISHCNSSVYIPTTGRKNSLNVHVASSILLAFLNQ